MLYAVIDLPQLARHGVQPGVPLAAAFQQILSGRRQVNGAGGADKQLRADALFQRFDAVADGGGGFVQQLRRAGETLALGNLDKRTNGFVIQHEGSLADTAFSVIGEKNLLMLRRDRQRQSATPRSRSQNHPTAMNARRPILPDDESGGFLIH